MRSTAFVLLAAAGLAGAAECNEPRVRHSWRSLSCERRTTFIDAVQALKDQGKWDEFATMHQDNSGYSHGSSAFLPWHRWFLFQLEETLRGAGDGFECVTIPYWDWERESGSEDEGSVFQVNTFGTPTGKSLGTNCVNEGLCDGWTASDGSCLDRVFASAGGKAAIAFTDEANIIDLVISDPEYEDFRPSLEGGPHAAPHNYLGGEMSSMRSPDDPLFFLHHGNVDRLWALWQDYHGYNSLTPADITDTHYFATDDDKSIDSVMPFSGSYEEDVTVRDTFFIGAFPDGTNTGGKTSYSYGSDNLATIFTPTGGRAWTVTEPKTVEQEGQCCCGDGTVCGDEDCDDGNTNDGDSCSNSCVSSSGLVPGLGRRLMSTPRLSDSSLSVLLEANLDSGMDFAAAIHVVALESCAMDLRPRATMEWREMTNMAGAENDVFFWCNKDFPPPQNAAAEAGPAAGAHDADHDSTDTGSEDRTTVSGSLSQFHVVAGTMLLPVVATVLPLM